MTEEPTEADDPDPVGSTPDDPARPPVTNVDDLVDDSTSGDGAASAPDGRATDRDASSTSSGESVTVSTDVDRVDPSFPGERVADGNEPDPGENASDGVDRDATRASTAGRDRSERDLERELLGPEERIGAREDYCNECGAVFEVGAEECPECGNPFPGQSDPPASTRKVPRLAAALSVLLPGAGQLYNEQYGKATLAFFGTLVLVGGIALTGLVLNVFLTVVTLGTLSVVGTVLMILAIAFGWLLPASIAAWDAYDQARSLNAR